MDRFSVENVSRILQFAAKEHKETTSRTETATSPNSLLYAGILFPALTQSMARHLASRGGNVLDLEERVSDGNGLLLLSQLGVASADSGAPARARGRCGRVRDRAGSGLASELSELHAR
ncbi:hypothetical protein F4779DRAFT_180721 [Xylariaceae sp. FL0662B]|nr:hypothetical protein F4779DRAFT_180721 [Xylariaceae sp. FL0662B]